MTKIEMINEIKNVVMNNGGYVNLGWATLAVRNGEVVRLINGNAKNIKYEKVAEVKEYFYHCTEVVTKAENVETEVENDTEKNVEDMTKKEIIAEIKKFMGNVCGFNYYFRYLQFMCGDNEKKTPLNCVMIGDDGILYYRHFGYNDRPNEKKLENCTKAELIAIDSTCQLYIDHLNAESERMEKELNNVA